MHAARGPVLQVVAMMNFSWLECQPPCCVKTARSGSSWLAALLASIIGPMKMSLHWAKHRRSS